MVENKSTPYIRPKMSSQGFWSAVVATVVVIFSDITATTTLKIPSLLSGIILVPVFTVLMVCVHDYVPTKRKTYSLLGLPLTVGYAVLIGFNYYMQFTLVRQNLYATTFASRQKGGVDPWGRRSTYR